jgi:hypothetical protein
MIPDDRRAPEGQLWVCCACGKTAEDRYGFEGEHSHGWDESCMLNARLFDKTRLVYGPHGRVKEVKES